MGIDTLLNDEDIDDECDHETDHSARLQAQKGRGGVDWANAGNMCPDDDIKVIPLPRGVAKTSIVFLCSRLVSSPHRCVSRRWRKKKTGWPRTDDI